VTDLGQEQLQLVTYPNGTIIDQDGQVIDPSHQRLIDQEGRIIDPSGQIVEHTGSQFNITISQPVTNIHVEQVGGGQSQPDSHAKFEIEPEGQTIASVPVESNELTLGGSQDTLSLT